MTHMLALCGGVGGAKLALGLSHILSSDELTIIVNTGDDFEHLGFSISPDIDTVLYTLAGVADPERGWGRNDETWNFMAALRQLGGEDWFQLGDRDLALHAERTQRLALGETLSSVTLYLAEKLGVKHRIVPASDDPLRTMVHTGDGVLSFQHYFVRERCAPRVTDITFEGAAEAAISTEFHACLHRKDLGAVILCPSNPYLSIDPILAIPGVRAALQNVQTPRIAVCPIIGGAAVKGPTGKLMAELGLALEPANIARHYSGLIDALVIDEIDAAHAASIEQEGVACAIAPTLMKTLADKVALARIVTDLANKLRDSAAAA